MNILKAMDVEQGKMMNQPLLTTTVKECKFAAATPTAAVSCAVGSDKVNGAYCVCRKFKFTQKM
jgi:hypothetical protein